MECLQKIWKSLCLLNPDSWAKVYINWASFLITSMWEVLWGWVVNRASQSLEIGHVWTQSFRVKTWSHNCQQKAPILLLGPESHWCARLFMCYQYWPQEQQHKVLKSGSVMGFQPLLLYISTYCCVYSQTVSGALFHLFAGMSTCLMWKEGYRVAVKIVFNEHTEQILLSVVPFQLHWGWGHLASYQEYVFFLHLFQKAWEPLGG